jgi:hypothetical protein
MREEYLNRPATIGYVHISMREEYINRPATIG